MMPVWLQESSIRTSKCDADTNFVVDDLAGSTLLRTLIRFLPSLLRTNSCAKCEYVLHFTSYLATTGRMRSRDGLGSVPEDIIIIIIILLLRSVIL